MQRRVEQADGDRQPGHRLEDPLEVALLVREQLVERGAALVFVARHDHLADDEQPVVGHEHVLGAAEPDALSAELARLGRVLGGVRVRAHLQAPHVVRPAQDGLEVLVDLRRDQLHLAHDHLAGAAVDRDHVALAELRPVQRRGLCVDVDGKRLAACDARLAHPARDDRGVRRHPTVGGQDPLRGDHPVDVVRSRLPANEDHGVAVAAALLGGVGVEDDPAGGGAG